MTTEFDGCPRGKEQADDWITYLKESGNYESYDGMCGCYACKAVVKGFEKWKYERSEREAMNISKSGDRLKDEN